MSPDWGSFESRVIDTLKEHGQKIDKIDAKVSGLGLDLANLKGRAAIWGLLAGAAAAGLITFFFRVLHS